jgi:hypothetical protein
MPRKPRIHVPGAFYHVTLRGNHRQDIFFSDQDRALLNEIVADVIEVLQARVHGYCWMTNHMRRSEKVWKELIELVAAWEIYVANLHLSDNAFLEGLIGARPGFRA